MITGAFRTVDKKETPRSWRLSAQILKAAEGGTVDKDGLKKFLQIAKIDKNYYDDLLGIANPKQRRNAGAPTTDTITARWARTPTRSTRRSRVVRSCKGK